MKILIQTLVPSPYRVSFFNELGKYCNLTVIFEGNRPSNGRVYNWNDSEPSTFKSIYLSKIYSNKLQPSILKYFISKEYDIKLICAYHTITGAFLITSLKLLNIKYIIEIDGAMINNHESYFKRQLKKFYLQKAQHYLSPSKSTDEYFKFYGKARPETISRYSFTSISDKNVLESLTTKELKIQLKEELNIKYNLVILSVGQFIFRKGFDILLKACRNLRNDVGIVIIGGEPTDEYLSICKENNIKNIQFLKFMDNKLLAKYYMASDLFVLPTREDIWGLVINEAMAYGLPIITTNRCVAGMELINNIKDCIVAVEDIDNLEKAINLFISNESLREKEGAKNLQEIRKHTIEKMAEEHYLILKKINNA